MVAFDISNWEVSCWEAPDVVFSIWAEPWFLFWMLYICLTNTRFSTSNFQKPRTSRLSEKTAYISRRHHWFPRKMTSEERLQKFYAGDVNYPDLGSASDWSGCEGNLPQPIRQTDHLYFSTMILKAMQRTKYIYIIK